MLFEFGGIFRKVWRSALVLGTLVIGASTLFVAPVSAATGINQQLNFQGRLLNSQGAIVVDGYYNVEFKIYQDGPGTSAGNPGGTLKWTEDWLNSGGNPVKLVNGYMSVQLGSINPFGNSIDWNQDTLWLSVNIGNTNTSCSTFATCGGDGEMIPMKRLSAVPYALNAAKLGGLTAAGFIQNTTTVQTATNMAIDGTARADTGILTPYVDTNTATALNIGTTNATSINLNQNVTVAANKTLTLTGGSTANRPASPTEGMLWYDTTTKQLLVYSNGKWQADRSTATKIVAASNASQALKDGADYVATGTGDQSTINTALTAAAGGKVYLTEGTYTINGSISVPNNTTLAGAGSGTVITVPNSFNTALNAITNTTTGGSGTGITIQDLKLDGNQVNQTSGPMTGIYFNGVGSGSGSSAIQGGRIMNVISGNWKAGYGIYVSNSMHTAVSSNTVYGVNSSDFIVQSSSDVTLTNNIATGPNWSNYYITGGGVTLSGNSAYGAARGFDLIVNAGSNAHTTLTGNTASGNGLAGINIEQGDYFTVSGNSIYNSGGTANNNGIYVGSYGAANYNTITGNTITDTSATTTNYPINIVSGSTKNYLADNTFDSGSINDAGTGTVYANQSRGANGAQLTNRTANDTEAFTVQNAGGINIFAVDTTNSKVLISGIFDTTASAALSIGTTNASSIAIGKAGATTTVNGNLTVGTSQTFTNNGATVNGTLALSNFATGGSIGNANVTVDVATSFTVNQTTASQTLTLPNPSNTSIVGRTIYISNIGSATFTISGFTIATNGTAQFVWNGSAWTLNGNVGGSGNFIQNTTSQQSANFNISGTGIAGILQAATFDTASAGTLSIGTTNATAINLNQNVVVASGKSLTLAGGTTASRPSSPTEGMMWYDTTTKQLLTYSNGKWQSDSKTATVIVAASNSSQAEKDGAQYVATGTGDQTVINNALTAAAGGKVYLAEGTYTINGSISVPNNTTLAGAGTGTIITVPNAFNADINAITNTTTGGNGTGITVQDLRVEGNKSNQTSGVMVGIYFNGVGSGTGNSAVQGGTIKNTWVNSWNDTGIKLNSSYNSAVAENFLKNNTTYSVRLAASSYYDVITGNTVEGGNYGITVDGSYFNTIANNTTQGTNTGIQVGTSTNNTITGNTVPGNATRGINLDNSSNNVINSNGILDSGGTTNNNAIRLAASSSNTIISNGITDTSATSTNYAINVSDSGSSSNYLASNTLGGGTVNDAGTGTIYASQYSDSSTFLIQPATNITLGSASTTNILRGNTGVTLSTTAGTTMVCQNASSYLSVCDSSILTPNATNFIQNQYASTQTGNFNIQGASTTSPTAVIMQASGGTSDIFQVKSASGASLVAVSSSGEVRLQPNGSSTVRIGNNNSATATALAIGTTSAGWVGLSVRGVASQTGDLLQLQDSSGNALAAFSAGGNLSVQNVSVAAGKTLTLAGGNTASRPSSPTEGMMWYDTDTKQLLTYSNGKWQADRNTSTKIVAASNASQALKDGADYVATGTGDQTVINNALTAAAGGKVYLTEGTYTVNGSISVPNNTTLAGAGAGTIITVPNALNASSFYAITNTTTGGSGTGITIQDLRLDGNRANQTSGTMSGVVMSGVGSGSGSSAILGVKITSVYSNNWRNEGFWIASGANSILTGNTALSNLGYGFNISGSSYNTITGNLSQGNIVGFYLSSASNTLTGNTIQGNSNYGIHLNTGSTNIISGNRLHANGGTANNNAFYLVSSSNNTITGNSVTDDSATTTNYAINITDSGSNANYLASNTLGTGTINDLGTGTLYGGQYASTTSYLIQPAAGITMGSSTTTTTIQGTLQITPQTSTSTTMLCTNGGIVSTCDSSVLAPTATNFIQNGTGLQTANFNISGTGAAGTLNATTALQTAGTTRVDASGNLLSIGNITATGTTTLNGVASATTPTLSVTSNTSTVTAPTISVAQQGTGDANVQLQTTADAWTLGADSSDDSAFKINSASNAGTTSVFGNNTTGTNTDSGDNNIYEAGRYTAPATGYVTNLSVYVGCAISSSPNNQFRMAIYNGNVTNPTTLISQSSVSTLTTGWNTVSIPSAAITNGSYYWIVYFTNGSASNQNCFNYTTGTGQNVWTNTQTFGAFASTWPGTANSSSNSPTFYATYRTAASYDLNNNALFRISTTGATTLKNSINSAAGFQVQNAAGTAMFNVDTTNSRVTVAGALDTTGTSLTIGATNATAITIGNASSATTIAGNTAVTLNTTTGATTMVCRNSTTGYLSTCDATLLTPTASNFIQNQNTADQSANLRISGTARANTSVLTPLLDTATAVTLNIGTTNATSVSINKSTTIATGMSLTLAGGTTANRPAAPTEGMLWYDTTTKQLLTYSNGKWQADRNTSTKIVAASNASQALKDGADYVATGTGDQGVINTALTAAAGGKVYLTEGTYTVSGSISIPNNTTLTGAGQGTLIQLADLDASANMIVNTDTTTGAGVVVRDMKLNGRNDLNTAGTQYGIYFNHVGDTASPGGTIAGLTVVNFRSDAFYLLNFAGGTVTGNTFNAATTTNGSAAIDARYNTGTSYTNNTFVSNYWGLRLDGSSQITVSNNFFYSNTVGLSTSSATNDTITGNSFTSNTTDMDFYQTTGTVVSSNTLSSNSNRGVSLDTSSNNTITDNNIQNSGGTTTNNAIYLTASSSNTITNNAITDSSATTNNYAINIFNATSSTNYLANNTLGTGTVNNAGTGTIYGGQYSNTTTYNIQPATGITMGSATTTTSILGTLQITPQTSTSTTLLCSNTGIVSTCDASVLTPTATNFIQNQNSADQTANLRISGTARANTSVLTPSLDVAVAGTLSIGTTTATGITLGKSGVATTTAGGLLTSTVDTATAGALTIGNTTATSVSIGKSAIATNLSSSTINVGTSGATTNILGAAQTSTGNAGNAMVIQGSTGLNGNGGTVTLQGGNANGTGTLGGNLTLAGGTGSTSNGAVILGTSAFNTMASDAACYPGGADSTTSSNCTIAQTSINNYAAVIVGFTNGSQIAYMPDPSITTILGRVVYVTASGTTQDFTLSVNGGGTGNQIAMRKNTTATMIWNGADWTAAGASSSTTLQAAYDNTLQSAGGAELVVSKTTATNGLTIRDSSTNSVNGALLTVQSSSAANLFSVNSNVTEYTSNSGAETYSGNTTTFPASTWVLLNGATVTRNVTTANIATGQGSAQVGTSSSLANSGVKNVLSSALTVGQHYNLSFSAKLSSGTFTDMAVYYSPDGTTNSVQCVTGQAIKISVWTKVNCTFTASGTISAANSINIVQGSTGTARTFYVDNISVTIAADYNYATDGGVDDTANFATNWPYTTGIGTGSTTRNSSDGYNASSSAGVTITAGAANAGLRNKLSINPLTGTLYRVSVYAKLSTGTFTDFKVRYSPDGGTNYVDCVDYNTQTITTTAWTQITCYVTTGVTAVSNPYVYFVETASAARTFYVDAFSMTLASSTTPNVQVGSGSKGGPTTLFTLDKGASAPIAANNDDLLGSMYYDTTLGKLQCYEADGWGACGSSPDNIVTISPEYTNAVMHGTGVGTMTSDFCSDALNINNSVNTPAICGTNETYNFYRWTSPQPSSSPQTYSIYVTYQLPATFKSFASGQTSLMGKTDSAYSTITYQVYRSTPNTALASCGTVSVSTGVQTTWQTAIAQGTADPSTCGFNPGDSIVFKINMTASANANAYVGNLGFTFSNK